MLFNTIRPARIRLEASSVCQLRCPLCPVHSGAGGYTLGLGFLKLADFQALVQENPRIKDIELANYGEIFLNPDLLEILRYAYERGIALSAIVGSNMNTVRDELLEGVVKYRLRELTCSIDGASQETYEIYRVNGDLARVLGNIRKLNAFKQVYRSEFPRLRWQFVVFGHNEHEIHQARELATELGMSFLPKLSWDSRFSPVRDVEHIRAEIGVASREEYRRRFGRDYLAYNCYQLWNRPQINWDGRVLGCSQNYWGDFGANAFTNSFRASINSPAMRYARRMILGKKPAREGIPCSSCNLYLQMEEDGTWLKMSEVRAARRRPWREHVPPRIRHSVAYRAARSVYRTLKPWA